MGCYTLKRDFVKNTLKYFVPALITACFILAVYLINGIYPFGNESVVYNDLGQTTLPSYYAVWDVVHGKASALFTWNTGGGVFVNSVLTGLLNPINLIFFLMCPRAAIFEGMSFLLLIKLALTAVTAFIFFDNKFSISFYWKNVLSVLYAFSPYLLQYYTNAEWLDVVLLFPLVILALDRVIERGNILFYVTVLTLTLFQSLYISYMVFLFLLLVAGLYIFIVVEKQKRKNAVFRFGLGSVLSLALSAVVTVPSYMYMSGTSRYDDRNSLVEIFNTVEDVDFSKLGMIIILGSILIAFFVLMLMNMKKDIRGVVFLICATAVCALPIAFENINLFWHMGSYMKFPMRFAFMLTFVLLTVCAFTLDRFSGDLFSFKPLHIPFMVLGSAFGGYGAYLLIKDVYSNTDATKLVTQSNCKTFLLVLFCLATFYFVIISFCEKFTAHALISILLVIEIFVNLSASVTTGSTRFREYRLDCIDICEDIREEWDVGNERLSRVKVADSTLNTNYPLMLGYPSMSNFTHIVPAGLQETMDNLGYSTVYTRILDSGGTPFTDALLNIKSTLSATKLDSELYGEKGTAGGYYIYDNKYTLPFGITFSSEKLLSEEILEGDSFEVNNKIYSAISKDASELFETPEYEKTSFNGSRCFYVYIDSARRLYIDYSEGLNTRKSTYLYVNGKRVTIPSLDEEDNERYTTSFNNKILDLGTFENETVEIMICPVNSMVTVDPDTVKIAALDTGKLASFCEKYGEYDSSAYAGRNSLKMSVKASDGEYVFLPITHDSGWSCTVNGEKTEIETALGSFMAVKLNDGVNEIKLKFIPRKMILGAVITAVSAAALVLWLISDKKTNVLKTKIYGVICTVAEKTYFIVVTAAICGIYIVSMLCTLINLII